MAFCPRVNGSSAACTKHSDTASRALAALCRTRTRGSVSRTAAIARGCFSPPDCRCPLTPTMLSLPRPAPGCERLVRTAWVGHAGIDRHARCRGHEVGEQSPAPPERGAVARPSGEADNPCCVREDAETCAYASRRSHTLHRRCTANVVGFLVHVHLEVDVPLGDRLPGRQLGRTSVRAVGFGRGEAVRRGATRRGHSPPAGSQAASALGAQAVEAT